MSSERANSTLSEQREAEADPIYQRLEGSFKEERKQVARLLASKPDEQLFGQTRSLNSAIGSIRWEPKRWRQPPTSGKKRGGHDATAFRSIAGRLTKELGDYTAR